MYILCIKFSPCICECYVARQAKRMLEAKPIAIPINLIEMPSKENFFWQARNNQESSLNLEPKFINSMRSQVKLQQGKGTSTGISTTKSIICPLKFISVYLYSHRSQDYQTGKCDFTVKSHGFNPQFCYLIV